MKKMTAMLMILTMMCTLAACGGSLMPTQPAPSAETSGAGEQQTEGKGGESQAAATETPVTEEVPATEAPAGAESSAEAVPAQETEPAPAETTQAAETENPSEAETIDPAEAQIEPDPYTPSDIRILPETLYLDDTVVGQQTVPGPDAGDYSKYQPEMFYGSWRVEDEGKFRDHSVTKAIFEETVTDFRGAEAAAEVLPWYLRFGIYNTDSVYRALSLHLDKATTGYITYGTGAASGEDHGYLMVYDVSGDTLAIGFFAVARDEILQGNHAELKVVREVRYRIVEWTGCRLTLQYGDRRVTYIPDMKLKQVNGVYELNWTGRHYLSKNCEVRDRLLEIGDTGNSGLTFDYGSDFYIPEASH